MDDGACTPETGVVAQKGCASGVGCSLRAWLVTASGVALTPLMTAPWQLVLLWGVVVGTGTGMTALVLGATVVNRWFAEQRGLVMGMLTASTATGQLLFLPLLAMIVEDLGWRTAVLGVACAALLSVGLPAAANAASGAYGAQGYGTTMYQTNWLYWGSVIQPVGSIPSTATLANIYWSIDSTSSINYNSGKRYRILHNNTSYMDTANASGGTSAFTVTVHLP